MDKKRNRMIKKYLLYVLGTGVILLLLCPWRVEAITGLAVSAATVTCNFKLLEYAIMNCTNGKKVLQLPGILIFRLLLYIGAAYFCVKIDYTSVITYAVGVIELTFAAVTEYGKGEKMINVEELGSRIILGIGDGKLFITESTIFGLILAAVLAIIGIWLGSGLKTVPKGKQIIAEAIVQWVYNFTEKNMGKENLGYAPYIGTIFAFVFSASALGVFGIRPITADLNVAFALSGLTFLMIQINAVRVHGLKGKLKEMCSPYPFMFPLKIIEECTLPVSLALRLFGNILGGLIVIELWMHMVTWLSSFVSTIPFLRAITVLPLNVIFDILDPAIQTYIFCTLTVINLTAAVKVLSGNQEH